MIPLIIHNWAIIYVIITKKLSPGKVLTNFIIAKEESEIIKKYSST